ncbi:MAG: 4-hydroxy-3-methylbut-2-enyl diphosphate reductase [Alphaproteobacteria bacterium]|nr:4-hydroxy-3-methylbut-2-enyl diphosphate reductase [Alphaproteobacteria bacterium]MBT5162154.1 4-hydroxy-3-methylbut-2-enyl diphosphate reductase [Alphaproteobacteria bacterium]MBT5919551.1 4-hydroxy-3-methylbut-2-enyl diphosphate reductase [Alphaproteobacteria bacterium]MBT6385405.1 4-hydroxy-3-methylbut-2-enyl diphosphate reductase [Alphaproteobacteria bacterium]
MTKPELNILLAAPRGFCAGVDRAVQIVERAIEKHGAPVYVRHEIVHNRFVVESLEDKGAVFVDELDEVPADAVVIFSAHGVPKSVPVEATRRELIYLDATCPLVSKVHREAERHHAEGRDVILIGHAGHPEVIGTMGQLDQGAILLVENIDQAENIIPPRPEALAYTTQTTLSVDETADIVAVLARRFPQIAAPRKEDICYATTNRQQAMKDIAGLCDALLVIGAPNSSNSLRLVEVARQNGCDNASLVQRARDIDWRAYQGVNTLGISAGASAPEILVTEVIEAARLHFNVSIKEVEAEPENVSFKLPQQLLA